MIYVPLDEIMEVLKDLLPEDQYFKVLKYLPDYGEWYEEDDDFYCSNCGAWSTDEVLYCDHCGAKMAQKDYVNAHETYVRLFNKRNKETHMVDIDTIYDTLVVVNGNKIAVVKEGQ